MSENFEASISSGSSSLEVAQVADVRVPKERVVVEVHLGVEGQEIARGGHDERIDLDQRRVGRDEGLVEGRHQLDGLIHLRSVEANGKSELTRFERHQPNTGFDVRP